MLEKIQEMLAEELNLPVSKVVADAKIVEDLGADSLDVVELLSRLEDEFGITIPDEDVENLVTVRDVATELEKLTGIKTVLYDERLTTVSAHNFLSMSGLDSRQHKKHVDELSARVGVLAGLVLTLPSVSEARVGVLA